jgi:hypothetical protein
MGEQRDKYRGKDRRDGSTAHYRCRCGWCSRPKLRKQAMADLHTGEAMALWYRGEGITHEEEQIRRSVPPPYRRLPSYALADYLEEHGRIEDAEHMRKLC